ncbi:unnamed protein product (macronuclear) [Paramecium tetraurelia]|uniref:EamA domain-containing protein n=1 Tax=Paramecium tetraurelia TaxID=5888 RepID=A0BWP6_PARTE|nr:uncharacterized protein GSPATT00032815001 [Paramecium tetraurelia]CAK62963.1 unnamed protein product [Paramecium tetraurelia]|eukprot:XP_001430361.1 hypothetical protein (macronuclear) [Paramecium tetraurelia strain d4-2]
MNQLIQELECRHSTAIPIVYSLLSSCFFALTALTIKLVPNVAPTQVLYVRSLFTIMMLKWIAKDKIDSYPQKQINKLQWRGLCGGLGTVAWFCAVRLIQSSEVIVLSKISPLWTALIAAYVTKTDKLTLKLLIIILLCIIGVALIARPPFLLMVLGQTVDANKEYDMHMLGVMLALTSSITQSIVQVIISHLAKSVHQIAILQYFSFYTIILPMLFELYNQSQLVFPTSQEWVFLLMNSASGGLAQFFMNRCFILGKLNKMSLVGQSQVLFSYFFDIVVLNESINNLSIIGSVLVCGCLISVIL